MVNAQNFREKDQLDLGMNKFVHLFIESFVHWGNENDSMNKWFNESIAYSVLIAEKPLFSYTLIAILDVQNINIYCADNPE